MSYVITQMTSTQPVASVQRIKVSKVYSSAFIYSTVSKGSVITVNSYSASHDNWCTVGGDGGCRVGEVRADTTSTMPDHKGFKLQ